MVHINDWNPIVCDNIYAKHYVGYWDGRKIPIFFKRNPCACCKKDFPVLKGNLGIWTMVSQG